MRQLIIATSRYKRRSRLATTILQSIRGNRSPSGAIDPPDSLRARARNFDFLFWKLDGHPSTRQSSFSWSTFPEELYSTERPDDWRPEADRRDSLDESLRGNFSRNDAFTLPGCLFPSPRAIRAGLDSTFSADS